MNLNRETWLSDHEEMTNAEERPYFEAGIITACEFEFGPHEDHDGCEAILDGMNGDDYDVSMDYPSYDPQTDFFEREGRPMFPNEY